MLVTSTVPTIDGCSPPSIVPLTTGARPFTVASPRCLILNSTVECDGSIDQLPVGIVVAEGSARMDIAFSFAFATIEYASNCTPRKMTSQVLSEQAPSTEQATDLFVALIRAHAHALRQLNAQLAADHGLTISDYEVLLRLSRAPDRRMRRVDLAGQVLLTASGVTRLLDGLERSGFVERGSCDSDRRVVYAVLTDAGLAKLRSASESHVAQIEDYFTSRYDEAEQAQLTGLLTRIGTDESIDCAGPD